MQIYVFGVPRPKCILNHSQNGYSAWTGLWFDESDSFSLTPPSLLVSVPVPEDDTVQTWPLAPSASARLSSESDVASQRYTHQRQLVKYAYRFSDLHLHLSVYLGDTQHDWCWSRLHLFCITVKQTMKEPWVNPLRYSCLHAISPLEFFRLGRLREQSSAGAFILN